MKVMALVAASSAATLGAFALTAYIGLSADDAISANLSLPTVVLETASNFVQCKNPRPEICYEVYAPVCALRDTGVRCITTPCPSTEQATYGNDCQACSDSRVIGFVDGGECK